MCVFQKSVDEINEDSNARKSDFGKATTSNKSFGGKNGPITLDNLDFSVRVGELRDLMQLKPVEAKQRLNESLGGTSGLAQRLKTDLQNGIVGSKEDVQTRVKCFGKNEIPPKPPKSIFRLAFEAVQDTTLIMLIICAIISIGLSFYHPAGDVVDEEFELGKSEESSNLEWVEGAAIMVAVVVVVFVTAFNDWRKERQFRGLQDRIEKDHMASVIRSGQVKQITLNELVVGDICCIKYGDTIPADGIIVQASDLKVDESSLTGETDHIKKGTHVMEGSGQILITAVGLNSQTGIIMTLLGATDEEQEEPEASSKKKKDSKKDNSKSKVAPESKSDEKHRKAAEKEKCKRKQKKKHKSVLQLKLGKLAIQIGYGGMLGALCTFIILCVRMAIEEFAIKKNKWTNAYVKYFISFLIQAITVVVVAVPEGLPLAVTLALAFAVRKMTKDNNLVRHLDACETMGNATTICSDKTGTLTTNRMTAVQCWLGGKFYLRLPENETINQNLLKLIYESISVNSNYTSLIEPATQPGELPKQLGNKTECGLLGFVLDMGGSYDEVRANFPTESFAKVYTFNSARKMMSTIIKKKEEPGYRLHSKGASEIVLSKCSYFINESGQPEPLSQEKIDDLITSVVEKMALNGLRTICVAYRDFVSTNEKTNDLPNVKYYDPESVPDWEDEPNIITNLTCLCLIGIEDPVRAEVPDAIKKCQTSGVVVRMVTGDNINTATSIALKCGIISPGDNYLILESKDFNKRIRDSSGNVSQDLLDKVWPRLRVLARSSPTDKYILVNGIVESKISSNREVVAVTGDGTNDGPALKRADVGFAMGIQGTDVAKEASDIILTDDNFSSIVKALMWGRNVYDAIAKFLQFQLTANFAAGIFSVVCAATIQAVPLKAVQMLWVNLVMDTLASLALATEPPTEDLLRRKPYGRTKAIISATMFKNIIGHAIYQIVILFCLVWCIEDWMQVDSIIKYNDINKLRDSSLHFTIIFNAFVIMTLFNELNGRKIHNERNIFAGIQDNVVFLVIWIGCFIGQVLIVNFGGIVFSVERLDWDHWMWCILFGFGSLLWGQFITTIPTSYVKKFKSFCLGLCRKKKANKQNEISAAAANQNASEAEAEEKEMEDYIEKSKILWLRGANRIQSQLQVVEAFKTKLDEGKENFAAYGSMLSIKDGKSSRPIEI